MHPLAKKLLLIRQMEIEEKHFKIMGKPVGVFPLASLFSLENEELQYKFGECIGGEIINLLKKFYPKKDEKLLELSFNIISLFGFGKPKILKKEDNLTLVEIESSPIAEEALRKGIEGKKTCTLIAGILKKIYSEIREKSVVAKELSCKAEGNPKCIFEVKEV